MVARSRCRERSKAEGGYAAVAIATAISEPTSSTTSVPRRARGCPGGAANNLNPRRIATPAATSSLKPG